MRSFIAVVGCSGGREGDTFTVDDSEMWKQGTSGEECQQETTVEQGKYAVWFLT